MNKNFLFYVLLCLAFVAAAVLWLLKVLLPDTFGFFSFSWAVVILAGVGGVGFLLKGLFEKNVGLLKKLQVFFGAGLILLAVVSLIFALALPKNIIWPVVAVIASMALLLSIFAVGGKKWDQGDNKKAGYKDYYARKKEEEKQKQQQDQ